MSVEQATCAAALRPQTVEATAKDTIGADYERFLKLLTAQIRNQDPLAPMDSTEFVSQLAQLSTVEQTVETNTKLAEIAGQIAGVTTMADIGLIGRKVSLPSTAVHLAGGEAGIEYETRGTAQFVKLNILDETGTVVRTLDAPATAAGQRGEATWDGRDANGTQVADGYYRVEINAENAAGETLAATSFATLPVREVALGESGTNLVLANGDRVSSRDVQSVR